MFFENTNLDFLDKRYPFKDIKKIYANKILHIPGKYTKNINGYPAITRGQSIIIKSIFIRQTGITH